MSEKKASFFEYDWDNGSPWEVKSGEDGQEKIIRHSTDTTDSGLPIKEGNVEKEDKFAQFKKGQEVIMVDGVMAPISGIVFERMRNADFTYRYTVQSKFDGRFYTVEENELAIPGERLFD